MPPNHCPTREMAAVRRRETKSNHQDKTKGEDSILDNAKDAPPWLDCTPQIVLSETATARKRPTLKKQCHDSD
jgi:hypothetical protein